MNTNQFSGKRLKRLWRFFLIARRAKAPELMRVMCLALACAPALKAALAAGEPTLVDIVCQPLHEAKAPVSEWVA